jgi:hypothetical protein
VQPSASTKRGVDFGGSEGVAGGDVREAHQRMHEGKLPGVIELEAGDALSGIGGYGALGVSAMYSVLVRGAAPRIGRVGEDCDTQRSCCGLRRVQPR